MSIPREEPNTYVTTGGETEEQRLAREKAEAEARDKARLETTVALQAEQVEAEAEDKGPTKYRDVMSVDGSRKIRVADDPNRAEVEEGTGTVKIFTAKNGKSENAESYYTVRADGNADAIDLTHVAHGENNGLTLRSADKMIFAITMSDQGEPELKILDQAAYASRIEQGHEYVIKTADGQIRTLTAEGTLGQATDAQKALFVEPDTYGPAPAEVSTASTPEELARRAAESVQGAVAPAQEADEVTPPPVTPRTADSPFASRI